MMTKPYAASGRYVDRMSITAATASTAPATASATRVPVHHALLGLPRPQPRGASGNHRMQLSLRNLERIDEGELAEIRAAAGAARALHGVSGPAAPGREARRRSARAEQVDL